MADAELAVLAQVSDLLLTLDDTAAQHRVVDYLIRRFGSSGIGAVGQRPHPSSSSGSSREMPGIAMLTDTGEIRITARDLKAQSAVDAAKRLIYLTLLASEQLKGEDKVSSRRVILPVLRAWRVYNGNTRSMMARDKGVIRAGDILSLDTFSRRAAEEYVHQISDDSVAGKWKP